MGVAVRLAYWSNVDQLQASSWYVLRDAADCEAFSTVIESMSRPFSNGTYMAPALDWAVNELTTNEIASERMVIDATARAASEGQIVLGSRDSSSSRMARSSSSSRRVRREPRHRALQ